MPRALLLIADIGGYTRFMKVTAANLAHSQQVVADLLEAVIDAAAPRLQLAKLEGDAAFLYAPLSGELPPPEESERLIGKMRAAFQTVLRQHALRDTCHCDGCLQAPELTLKFVAHVGEVAFQKVERFTELAGVDVILVHRMLKNDVPLKEYLLMSEGMLGAAPPSLRSELAPLTHDFEGLGTVQTFYSGLTRLPEPQVQPPTFFARWGGHVAFLWRSLPYLLGFRRRHTADVVSGTLPG